MKKLISHAIFSAIMASIFTSCTPRGIKIDVNKAIGTCPKCKAEVVGEMAFCDGTDELGNPISWTEYMAQCKCGVRLYSFDNPDINSRIIWKSYTNEYSNQQVDPIVKTPVDEVEAQGTQGHP